MAKLKYKKYHQINLVCPLNVEYSKIFNDLEEFKNILKIEKYKIEKTPEQKLTFKKIDKWI